MINKILNEIRELIDEYDPKFEKCRGTVLRTQALIAKMVEETGDKHGIDASYNMQAKEIRYPKTFKDTEPFLREVHNEMYQLYYALYNDLILIFITDTKVEN